MRVESSPATQSLGYNSSVVRRIFMLILGITFISSLFVTIAASAFAISLNTEVASEGIDVLVFWSEFNLYDKLAITINNNGNIETAAVDYDSTVNSIAKPEAPTGYEFKGWCLDSSCNTPVNHSTIFNSNTTLNANWELISITARIGDKYYNSLADAIEAVPSDNVETEVVLLRDVTEATINVYSDQNIFQEPSISMAARSKVRAPTQYSMKLARSILATKTEPSIRLAQQSAEKLMV